MGPGVPMGGTANQILRKASPTNYHTAWSTLTKSDVSLGNVDNTSDVNKPVSTAQQAALDLKAAKTEVGMTLLSVTAMPASGVVAAISLLQRSRFRTYEFVFEDIRPNANVVGNNLVFQIGDSGGAISSASYTAARSGYELGVNASSIAVAGDVNLSFAYMGTAFGHTSWGLRGRMALHLPPAGFGAHVARWEGKILYTPSTSGNVTTEFSGITVTRAADTDFVQFFIWDGAAVQSWKSPTVGRILLFGVG